MKNFNLIRLRSYLEHLMIGTAAITVGGGILYGILQEMITAYNRASRYAYLWGLILCGLLIAVGVLYIVKAVYLNRRIFKSLTKDEKRNFFK